MTVVVYDDHPAVVAGIRAWCAAVEPPITVTDAGDSLGRVWTEPGASADVVVFDLQIGGRFPAFRDLSRLPSLGRVWTEPGASADVVVFDLQIGGRFPAFRDLSRLPSVSIFADECRKMSPELQ